MECPKLNFLLPTTRKLSNIKNKSFFFLDHKLSLAHVSVLSKQKGSSCGVTLRSRYRTGVAVGKICVFCGKCSVLSDTCVFIVVKLKL